jgi:hypothetical protein
VNPKFYQFGEKVLSRLGSKKGRPENLWFALTDSHGTSLLEFSLLLPILVVLLLGIIDIGRYADAAIVVASAARAGAQYGAQNLITAADQTGIANAAQLDAANNSVLNPNYAPPSGVQAPSSPVCGCPGSAVGTCSPLPSCGGSPMVVYLQVNASGEFKSLFSFFPGLNGTAIQSTSQVLVETQ